MKNKIYNAFNDIKAEENLKQDTLAYLQGKINKKNKLNVKRFAVAFASVFLIFFAGALSYNLYFTESAIVDIDVNPSIELTINRFNRIINVYAYNDDGNQILSAVNVKHKPYDEAVKILIDEMAKEGYIKEAGLFSATLRTDSDQDTRLATLKTTIASSLQSHHNTFEMDVFAVDGDTKTHSHEQNITPAKYLAILELQAVDPTVTFETCKDHAINEIKQQTHDHANGSDNGDNEDHESGGENDDEHQTDNGSSNNNHTNQNEESHDTDRKHDD